MKVKYINRPATWEDGRSDSIQIFTDEGKEVYHNSAKPLAQDSPEDATLERDMIACSEILETVRLAYCAGKNGEELIVEEIEKTEEDDE